MEYKDLATIVKETPLFFGLTEEELAFVTARAQLKEYRKGTLVYQEGAPVDAFYCVVLGRVVIYSSDRFGSEKVLEYLHRGKYFGIISLLTGEPHSVTAKAINDCLLLAISKDDFADLLKTIPRLAIDLSQTLSRRLKNKDIHQKTIFESTVLAVFSSYAQAGKSVYALNVSLSLRKETGKSVVVLDIASEDKEHSLPYMCKLEDGCCLKEAMDPALMLKAIAKGPGGVDILCFKYDSRDESAVRKLVGLLTILVNDYKYIVLDMPAVMDEFVFAVLNQADLIHLLTSPDEVDLRRTRNLVERLTGELHFQMPKIKVLINEYKLSKMDFGAQAQLVGQPIFATLPKLEMDEPHTLVLQDPDSEYAKVVRRISREVGDCLVGLALGVGFAYGLCHIGVLKVIERERIPVDVISGASIGSIIAALWVTGRSADEILEITKEFKGNQYVWKLADFTLPTLGFIKGNRLHAFLKKYIGNKTFKDIRLPLKIIASDIKKKEPIVLDKGLLSDAIMASCAMPGVFHPFKLSGQMLMDGGVTNPLPTEVLFKMGVSRIIAVNVTPSREDIRRQYEVMKEQLAHSRKNRTWMGIKNFFQEGVKNNIIDIVFSSIEVMQSELVQRESELADIVLHPDTSGLHWLQLHRAEEFARRGEEEARRNLEVIHQIVRE